ncbi:DUF6221 family protein [Streptomyces sp. CC208A]|uniref:DUF6221 family protein n=1 Tax=Streptomyces sp. CC208A TaxID=3044573 RepID=UPI0024A9DB68|nr:DUF6221 family protein [Streptomyces sp. CC208A]
MVDLVQFLRARLDEDAAVARAAKPGPWAVEEDRENLTRWVVNEEHTLDVGLGYVGNRTQGDAAHIARHDPTRVLAEVEAKRQIIEQHERYAAERRRMMGGWDPQSDDSPILAALATVYADHPDYRPEWAPTT